MKLTEGRRKAWTFRREEIKKMRDKGLTLQEIGDHFNITRERVRQVLDKYFRMRGYRLSTRISKGIDKK